MDSIRVVGANGISKQLGRALGADTTVRHTEPLLTLIADWPDVRSLRALADESPSPFALVEQLDDGFISVGPVFGEHIPGCLDCYFARRRANGGRECRPPIDVDVSLADAAISLLRSALASKVGLQNVQIELGANGHVRHWFLPVPSCLGCARTQMSFTLPGWQSLISPRLGVVHDVQVQALRDGYFAAEAIGCRTDAFSTVRALNHGMAVDHSAEHARRRATAESIERYCAALPLQPTTLARPDELDGTRLNPCDFYVNGPRVNPVWPIHWVKATRANLEDLVWAPASLVHVPYVAVDGECDPGVSSSVGLAAAENLRQAVERGLAEIIERDTCIRAWRNNDAVESLPADGYGLEGLRIARVPNGSGFEVVAAFLESGSAPFTSTGLGARPIRADASLHAVFEAIQSQRWLERWLSNNGHHVRLPPRTMIDNAVAHAVLPELIATRSQWLYPRCDASPEGQPKSWADLVRASRNTAYVDVTTPDVAAAGIKVVRVLAPGRVLSDDDALQSTFRGCTVPHPFG